MNVPDFLSSMAGAGLEMGYLEDGSKVFDWSDRVGSETVCWNEKNDAERREQGSGRVPGRPRWNV